MKNHFLNLNNYIIEKNAKIIEIAGIVILYQNKILLCYPKGKKNEQQWSIPKGKVNKGEDTIKTAIRETYEEIGIKLKKSQLQYGGEWSYVTKDNMIKHLVYYICKINNLKEIGMENTEISKKMLQKKEIKEARFFKFKEAKEIIKYEFSDLVKKLKLTESKYIHKPNQRKKS
jgi:ADP-ribose pyrophosphatase YjhB (NUDIX family)